MNYHEAVDEMYKGNVVQYSGTINGNIWSENGAKFCMLRGVIFRYPSRTDPGAIVYDPDFRFKLTGEIVDTRSWV